MRPEGVREMVGVDGRLARGEPRAGAGEGLPVRVVRMLRKKLTKTVAKYFPWNPIRVFALRGAGYRVGSRVYVGEEFHVIDDLDRNTCSLTIGDRVAIAARVLVILSSHPNNSVLRGEVEEVHGSVAIADDAWIGAGAIILPNVTVGEQAVVGAGSIVTRDVAPRTVVAGNPAQLIRVL